MSIVTETVQFSNLREDAWGERGEHFFRSYGGNDRCDHHFGWNWCVEDRYCFSSMGETLVNISKFAAGFKQIEAEQ